jgi:hypothetical protein
MEKAKKRLTYAEVESQKCQSCSKIVREMSNRKRGSKGGAGEEIEVSSKSAKQTYRPSRLHKRDFRFKIQARGLPANKRRISINA